MIMTSSKIDSYLKATDIIDYENEIIQKLADRLFSKAENKTDYIRVAFEFVRDNIEHSADYNREEVTLKASEVVVKGHGICFAKSHLLAALLRCKGIPTGFCYQRLILDDETAPYLILHGLNGVYIEELDKWIRLDPRGNKEGVNAQFSLSEEILAFPIRKEKCEEDILIVFDTPDQNVISALEKYKSRKSLWQNLPKELSAK